MLKRIILFAVLFSLGLFTLGAARAQDYPNRAVRIIVPYAPGGGVDVTARILAQQLSDDTGQRYFIENKAGATGMVGSEAVSTSKPDGYTLLYIASTLATAPFLLSNIKLDVLNDLTPITQVAYSPYVIVVNPKITANNLKDLATFIKANPKEFGWAVGGIGSPDHLGIEHFNKLTGIKPLVVPYNGTGPAVAAVVAGEIAGAMLPPAIAKVNIDAGKLKGLGVTSLERAEVLPNIPTVASSGFPGFDSGTWYAVYGSKQMPPELAKTIHQQISKAAMSPMVKEKLRASGMSVSLSKDPASFAAFFEAEYKKYGALIKELNLKPNP